MTGDLGAVADDGPLVNADPDYFRVHSVACQTMGVPNAVRSCAQDVNDELGLGLRENAYHKALLVALSDAGIQFTTEATIPILYRDMPVARMHPDLIVGSRTTDRYIVEVKVDRDGTDQLQSYCDYADANGMDCVGGLAISFGQSLSVTTVCV